LALRASVAAGAAIGLAYLLRLETPLFAFLAAVIVTDLTPSQSRQLGLRRLVATAVGAVCGATLSPWLASGAFAIAASILIAMLISHIVGAREGAKVAGFICGILVLEHNSEPWLSAYHRFLETALGVLVAWGVSYVPKLIRLEQSVPAGELKG
jgi:uncharacterized membrane protein YgaE (UPF0421/DUF939 family)